MDNSIIEKSPAKINLFLKILNRREDNYHNIRTGITSINLCDEIEVKPSNQFNIEYRGAFACLLYTSPSPRDRYISRMPSSA